MRRRHWATSRPAPNGCCSAPGSCRSVPGRRSLVAQTAITLSNLSNGRFLLGLGASGPQVIEGLHGVSFSRPLARIRETVDIVRQVFEGGKISYSGKEIQIPRPGGEAVPMRLSTRARARHSDLSGHAVAGDAALDRARSPTAGWAPASSPKAPREAYFAHLDEGLAAAGRTRADIDICQGAEVAFAADEDELRGMVAGRKKELAFSLGGMGSSSTNYYNQAYSRQGWADVAAEVRERWQARRPRRRGRAGDRRDGAGHHAHRDRGDGPRAACGVARRRREHRAALSRGRHVGCQADYTGPGHRAGPPGRADSVHLRRGVPTAFTSFTSGRAGTPSARNHRKARLPRG